MNVKKRHNECDIYKSQSFPTGQLIADLGYLLAKILPSKELFGTLQQLEKKMEKDSD